MGLRLQEGAAQTLQLGWRRVQRRAHVPARGERTRECLVQDDAERVPIGRFRHGIARALLGRHVLDGSASGRVAKASSQPEVEQHHAQLCCRFYQEIRGLEVGVHRAELVHGVQGRGQLPCNREHECRLITRARSCDQRG